MGQTLSQELRKDSLYEENKAYLERILQLLRTNDTDTRELDLSNRALGAKGAEIGSPALISNTNLIRLNLAYNCLGPSVSNITTCLSRNCALKVLNLSGNTLGEEGCQAVAQMLSTNTTLEELILFNNNITDKALVPIVNALQVNVGLRILNLSHNSITDLGVEMICKALGRNASLQQVIVKNNGTISELWLHKMEKLLENNRALYAEIVAKNRVNPENEIDVRLSQEEEIKMKRDEALRAERERLEKEFALAEERKKQEQEEILRLEWEQQLLEQKRAEEREERLNRRQAQEHRLQNQLDTWKCRVQKGQAKDVTNGFTSMRMNESTGDWEAVPPPDRKLVACWCNPQENPMPYAQTLHYHCKYETDYADSRYTDTTTKKYEGCRGSNHVCASVGGKVKPVKNESPATFFASEHPMARTHD